MFKGWIRFKAAWINIPSPRSPERRILYKGLKESGERKTRNEEGVKALREESRTNRNVSRKRKKSVH